MSPVPPPWIQVPSWEEYALGFDVAKAAELSAYLLIKSSGSLSKLKLVKLLYLAERKHAETYGFPMFLDRYFAVKHGPICSRALAGLDGEADQEVWSKFVVRADMRPDGKRRPLTIALAPGVSEASFQNLSTADREIADELLREHGKRQAFHLRAWTHSELPEYREKKPKDGRRIEITPSDMARGFGHPDPQQFAKAVEEIRSLRASWPL